MTEPSTDATAIARESTDTFVQEQVELQAADGASEALEAAVEQGRPLFESAHGCRGFKLSKSLDVPGHYRLTVLWETLDDHVVGFRESEAFPAWRALVTPHLVDGPKAEHFQVRYTGF